MCNLPKNLLKIFSIFVFAAIRFQDIGNPYYYKIETEKSFVSCMPFF